MAQRKPPPDAAWAPVDHAQQDAIALKALQAGTADPDQQRRALDWIIHQCCRTYDLSYRPTSDRDTVFAEGRRFVGLEIVKVLNIPLARYRKADAPPTEQP